MDNNDQKLAEATAQAMAAFAEFTEVLNASIASDLYTLTLTQRERYDEMIRRGASHVEAFSAVNVD